MEDSIIGPLIVRIAEDSWEGRPSELLTKLEDMVSDKTKDSKRWPKAPNTLSGELRRLVPALRADGIEVEFSKTPGSRSHRLITIRKVEDNTDASDASDAPVSEGVDPGVDGVDPGAAPTHPSKPKATIATMASMVCGTILIATPQSRPAYLASRVESKCTHDGQSLWG